jgi:hypothetical protein
MNILLRFVREVELEHVMCTAELMASHDVRLPQLLKVPMAEPIGGFAS